MRQPLTVPCPNSNSEKVEDNLHGSSIDSPAITNVNEIDKSTIMFKMQLSVGKYTEIWKGK